VTRLGVDLAAPNYGEHERPDTDEHVYEDLYRCRRHCDPPLAIGNALIGQNHSAAQRAGDLRNHFLPTQPPSQVGLGQQRRVGVVIGYIGKGTPLESNSATNAASGTAISVAKAMGRARGQGYSKFLF